MAMKRKGVTAEEALARLEADPAYRERRAVQATRRSERKERRLKAEQPLIADLAFSCAKSVNADDASPTP